MKKATPYKTGNGMMKRNGEGGTVRDEVKAAAFQRILHRSDFGLRLSSLCPHPSSLFWGGEQ
jgi:hypothetical protein